MEADPGAFVSAAVVASIGLWWFQYVLKDVRKLQRGMRLGVYALIWLAYFILTIILVAHLGDAQR